MIGMFGLRFAEIGRLADLDSMASAVDADRYAVIRSAGPGCALGAVHHKRGPGFARFEENGLEVLICGELFNSAELVPESGGAANAAAVVASLYRSNGLTRLRDANGLFSIAIHDRDAHRLVLITDRYCGYPIHVHKTSERIVFAGQLAVLLAEGTVPRKADPAGLAQLFTLQRTMGRDTNLAAVEAMPAATIRTIDRDSDRETRYWDMAWSLAYESERDAARAMAEALQAAVVRQSGTGAEAPGLLMSGGLDSRMVLAASNPGSLACFTTASYAENPELAIARQLADAHGRSFSPMLVEPSSTLDVLDQTTVDSNGLYPASTQFSAFLPDVGRACDVVLTGHGLDYTFRGYYLPARFLKLAGSSTRLPALRQVPARPTGADVLGNLRQGPPKQTIDRLVLPQRADFWWSSQADRLQGVLAPWLESDEPLNAWDAFILHSLSKHYAFTGMMAIRAACNLRLTTYDKDVFSVYLGMPPAWRIRANVALGAMRHLSPAMARVANSNTGWAADIGPWKEIFGVLAMAAGRRIGLISAPKVPTAMHSAGSWQNLGDLYRHDPKHRAHFQDIRNRLDGLCFDLLSKDAMAACIDEHLSGSRSHAKLLRHVLTHDAWVRKFGIDGIG